MVAIGKSGFVLAIGDVVDTEERDKEEKEIEEHLSSMIGSDVNQK